VIPVSSAAFWSNWSSMFRVVLICISMHIYAYQSSRICVELTLALSGERP
jgi:hypothetical protein